MRQLVFKSAWQLVKSLGLSLSEALVRAWKAIKLKTKLQSCTVYFQFLKKDGSIREACGTLKQDAFDYVAKGTKAKPNYGIVSYYDLDAKGFRSFRVENLI